MTSDALDSNETSWFETSWYEQATAFMNNNANDNNDAPNADVIDGMIMPDNWLLDLYGLGDEIRKKHSIMNCAIQGFKYQLIFPPLLAEKVAYDVMHEIEQVDPYLIQEMKDLDLVSHKDEKISIPFSLEQLKKINVNSVKVNRGYIRNCQRELLLDKDCDNPYFDILNWFII